MKNNFDIVRIEDLSSVLNPSDRGEFPIAFGSLYTVEGKKLPNYKTPPSIQCRSNFQYHLYISQVHNDMFSIKLEGYGNGSLPYDDTKGVTVELWICDIGH